MKIHNRHSHFTTVPEAPTPKRRRFSVSRALYLLFLTSILLYLLFLAGRAALFLSARGYVMVEGDRLLQAEVAGRIIEIAAQRGDMVRKGQVLVRLRLAAGGRADLTPSTSLLRERLRARRELELARSELASVRGELRAFQGLSVERLLAGKSVAVLPDALARARLDYFQRQARLAAAEEALRQWEDAASAAGAKARRRRVYELEALPVTARSAPASGTRQRLTVEVEANRSLLTVQRQRIARLLDEHRRRLAGEVQRLKAELAARSTYLRGLQEIVTGGESAGGQGGRILLITAPTDGRLEEVFVTPDMVVERGRSLVLLRPANTRVRIDAFFKLSALDRLEEGKRAWIRFPDGSRGKGVVQRVLSTARTVPRPEYKDYMPLWVRSDVEIVPENAAEAAHWRRYEQMDVKVRIRR